MAGFKCGTERFKRGGGNCARLGNLAAGRLLLVLRIWHFHIHRASVLFDLQAEDDRIQHRAARVFKRFAQDQARRTRAATLCQARALRKSRGAVPTGTEADLLLVLAR